MVKSMMGLLLWLAASSLLLVGIAGMGLLSPTTFGADDNGKNVTVSPGETFWVKLPENPTTGYAWDLKLSDGLTKLSDAYEPAERSGMKVGVGGTHSYEIKATKNGTQMIAGSYVRPGNEPGGALETYALTVNVESGGPLSWLFHAPAIAVSGPRESGAPRTNVVKNLIQPGENKSVFPKKPRVMSMPEFPMIPTGTFGPSLPGYAAIGHERDNAVAMPRDIKVSYRDVPPTADSVMARVGDRIVLQLSQNPSTGYSWQMAASDGLRAISDRSLGSMAPPNVVGAPSMYEWVYEVTKPGKQTITAVYKRPWEGHSEGEKTYVLTVDAS